MAQDISRSSNYQDKLLELLGERDPLKVLADSPGVFGRLVGTRSAEFLRRRPFDGKWSPTEIIGHLVDTEWVYGFRVRLVLSEDEPTILGMDQDKWVAAQQYGGRDGHQLLQEFGQLRSVNLGLWKQVGPSELERRGRHNERGLESLGLMRKMHAAHDLWHVDQLTRYIAALEPGRAGV